MFFFIIKSQFEQFSYNFNNDNKAPNIIKKWDFNGENILMLNNIINIVDYYLLYLIDFQVLDSEKFIEIKYTIIN